MQTPKNRVAVGLGWRLALTICIAAATGCDPDDQFSDEAAEFELDVSQLLSVVTLGDPDDPRIVARIAFPELESSVALYDLGDGTVMASELSHHTSMLDRYMAEDATALEMFTTTAPAGVDVPEALRLAHRAERGDAEPRDLHASTHFRHWEQDYDQYAADCSFAGDGQTYFDGRWQNLGWDHHAYHYLNDRPWGANHTFFTGWTRRFRAHVCVRDVAGHVIHSVSRVSGPALPAAASGPFGSSYQFAVETGERSIVYLVHSNKNRRFKSFAAQSDTADYNHGLMWK